MTRDQTSAQWLPFGPSGECCANSLSRSALLASLPTPKLGNPARRDGVFLSLSFCGLTRASVHEQQMFFMTFSIHHRAFLPGASPLEQLYLSRS